MFLTIWLGILHLPSAVYKYYNVIFPVILHTHEALVLTLRENYTNRF